MLTPTTSTSSPRRAASPVSAAIGFAPVQWWLALIAAAGWVLVLALAAQVGSAHAAPLEPGASAAGEGLEAVRTQVQAFARQTQGAVQLGAGRVEVVLGDMDARLRLAPCQQIRPYWPSQQRAWGATRIGVRCEQGQVRWSVYWPAVVKVWVRGAVAKAPLRAGQVLSPDDLQVGEVDLAARTAPAILHPADVVGRTVARAVQPGQSLRADDLRPRRYFEPGEPVALTVRGDGFQVVGAGTAITAGDEGQCARIRTDSGRVVCGQPVGTRKAEIAL